MKFATFMAEIKAGNEVEIPRQVSERLRLQTGDRVEISLKRVKSKRLDLLLAENPLYQLLNINAPEAGDQNE